MATWEDIRRAFATGATTYGIPISNLVQLAGTAIAVGAGAVSAGVQRMTLASDDPLVALAGLDYPDTSTASVRDAINGTSAEIAVGLATGGKYWVWSDVDCHFRQGATAGTAVTTDFYLPAGTFIQIRVIDATADGFIQVITGGIAGGFYTQLLS